MRLSKKVLVVTLILIILTSFTGCATPTPSQTPSATQTTAVHINATATTVRPTLIPTETSAPTSAPIEHGIAIRTVNGVGEFYNRLSGEKFIPRGNNYIRLAQQQSISGERIVYHSTFNVNLYNPEDVEAALSKMQEAGYNVVRVFIQGSCKDNCIGDPSGGVLKAYVANVVDFLRRAKSHDIYVMLTTDTEPGTPYYFHILDSTWSKDFGGTNSNLLRGGGILMGKAFWHDLIKELILQNAPLDAIFAYELRNELFFESNVPPLSYTSGTFMTANGLSYDMASEDDRQRMMDENLLLWIDQIRSEILQTDPTALVTVGFFVPQGPNPTRIGDTRLIETRPVIWESSLDFIDLHPYPGFGCSLSKYVENFGIENMQEKPIIMGEFGAIRSSYPSAANAARAMQDWQVESCQYGFDGWLLWTYDMPDQVFYNGLSDDGEIDQVLAPANRSDPCQPGEADFFENNLALGARVEASRSLGDQPPAGAVDGTANLWWGAGAFAPQWILIDLGSPQTVGSIRLSITQSPAGDTVHQVWVGASIDGLYLLHTFEGYTMDGQLLEFKPDSGVENIRYVRVNTRQSPSWIGWREIEILAP